jgi:protocatechuate 3,4-dioxygenase beta subunit
VDEHLTRRRLLELGLALPLAVAACSRDETETLAPTPACADGDEPTPEQTEGPFFTPDSPERTSLLDPGVEGTELVVAGTVLATDCTPIAGALLDFWHSDASGEYDNEGYRLRGHQFADAQGRYRLETIEPGLYTGRTRHIHVKAQAPDGPILTTQLYFPDEPGNASDGIFDPALVMSMLEAGSARFDFVLESV